MKLYSVIKMDSKSGKQIANYGQMCEDDMKLTTRGYKQDDLLKNMYDRKGSRYFFIVDEIPA